MSVNELAREDLERSDLTLEDAEEMGMYAVEDATEIYEDFEPLPALVLPYYDADGDAFQEFTRDGKSLPFARVRYLVEPPRPKGLVKRKAQRYGQPRDSGVKAFFPHIGGVDWAEVLNDVDIPITITEGEKKAARICKAGLPCIGLGGVFNFMENDALIPSLAGINWHGRSVYICFDSDALTNPNIQTAEGRLATELGLHRDAEIFLVRIPKLKNQDKTGADDYIAERGENDFVTLFEKAPQMRKLDAAVIGLNDSIAWIESEGLVYDTESEAFIRKHDLCNGSKYSALEMLVPTVKGNETKKISIAAEWLKHPHARRYQAVIFDPTTRSRTIMKNGIQHLNLWRGWEAERGDVEPFLELSEFLFSELPTEHRSLPLKLMAFKAQNPGEKVPLALVLLGSQGCGKSLWAKIIREAFAPYGAAIPSAALLSDFNGWVESSLVGVIDEAQAVHIFKAGDILKSMISEQRVMLNEKYRAARQVDNFVSFILTSNDRRVGAYSVDDRRMVVISAPDKREDEFYDRIVDWRDRGGPKKLLYWLLNYDLKGWRPPKNAPMSSEKYMAYMENLSPVQRLAEEMRTADHNVVKMWMDSALSWAKVEEVEGRPSMARAASDIKLALSRIQIRPFYTPEELAMVFPAVVETLHGRKGFNTPAGEISRQLRENGIPYLRCADDPRGFMYQGRLRQFLIVANPNDWRKPLTQEQFDSLMSRFPRYGEM